uniref:TSA: Wollemia nobilis Ref_Wollemi_Transcript_9076_1182 transcribed RNA sequence n=1 Tax=Wollemia nobilis TaxID=56998 RepID=A0A0C9S962_9CONI
MALGEAGRIAVTTAALGILAFVFGVVAENKKPASGTAMQGKGIVICKFPYDPSIVLGSFAIVCSLLSSIFGVVAVIYPYKGKSVPAYALQRTTSLVVFFAIAMAVSLVGMAFMMWATITEGLHRKHNVHHDVTYTCPTAKTGLFGGASFLCLDAALFWLICQMLTLNARADYEEEEEDLKGQYGQVTATDYT